MADNYDDWGTHATFGTMNNLHGRISDAVSHMADHPAHTGMAKSLELMTNHLSKAAAYHGSGDVASGVRHMAAARDHLATVRALAPTLMNNNASGGYWFNPLSEIKELDDHMGNHIAKFGKK
jgi:hypothetical protein